MNNAPEPEAVSALVQKMMSAKNGDLTDEQLVVKIYGDFRWGIKKASMLGQVAPDDIIKLLNASIKRIKKQVNDEVIAAHAVDLFVMAKNKFEDWLADEALRTDTCPKCSLPRFLCGCVLPE